MTETEPNLPDLTGRVALVTGASRGLGRATALALARAGADVVVTYRSQADEAARVADEIRSGGRRSWVYPLDLEQTDDIDHLFRAITDDIGGLDICVLNAAATSFRPLLDAEPRHLRRTYEISCVGFLSVVQRCVPLMQEGGGTIVGVSGADTRTYIPAHGILAGAKAAMEAMIRYLAVELGPTGITLLGVNPGTILGDSIKSMLGDLYAYAVEAEERTHPLQHGATPEDIAESMVALCGPASRWAHGSIVDLDGGSVFAMTGRWMQESTNYFLTRDGLTDVTRGPSVSE
ncbi:MAG: SDR family oxidoreductase [Acidimicrobiia bacterium]|nr:SDR family oxidoreductase [Acidimicrobiia bacterium]MDH5237283.1 SDR family oxidoreductase [Acidimicrobiia bacterium]